jgi:RNA polymerase sigma-70 factor (sigma-E family)
VAAYEGFEEFFVSRQAPLTRTAYFLTGDLALAEELLQSAMTKTAARWGSVNAGGNPEAYVRRVMLNEVRSSWRRRRRLREYTTQEYAFVDSDARELAQFELRHALAGALRALTPAQRAVLVYRFFLDESEQSTAAAMGCSVGTVKSQTHRALQKLRKIAPELSESPAESEVTHE